MLNKLIYASLLMIMISCNDNTTANNTAAENNGTVATDETAAVTAAVENFRKAMVDADQPALDKLTAADLSYGHSSGRVEDKAAFINSLSSGASDFVTIDLTDQTVKVSGDVAVVRHKLSATTNDNGTPGTVTLSILTVWQKQQGEWKLLARQAVKVV